MKELQKTARVEKLRDYYLNNSKMATDKNMVFCKCHRSLMLYVEGWKNNIWNTDTARIRRSAAEAYMLENTRPVIIPGELIVGQPCFDDFSPEEEERYKECLKFEKIMPVKRGRADHLALDYQLLLDKGIKGIIEILDDEIGKLNLSDGSCTERYEFLYCCKIELQGLLKMCDSYSAKAKELADNATGAQREEYYELYEVLKQVPSNPARTFREALQSIHMFTWSLYGIYSFGKPDVYLLPYYRHDIESGILTPESAQELIDCFFLQTIPNMSSWAAEGLMLGGRNENGNKVENELTWHFLRAIEHTHLPDPNVGFCVTEETSEEILNYAARLIAGGHCQPQIWNSDEVTRSMLSNGFDEKAANMFTLSTCVETTPIGCSGISITSPYINLLKVFLEALKKCDDSFTFEQVFDSFKTEFEGYAKRVILQENLWQVERARNSTDPMRISVLIHDCIERGKSNDCGGARYNELEPNILGMQNVTESLNVIKRIVFDEKRVTVSELNKALENNFADNEELLLYIRNKVTHFGTGDKEASRIAKTVADMVLKTFSSMKTVRGAKVIPGAFSYREHEIQGRTTPASPDGRKAGMPLNDGSCPVQGYDNLGPTLSLISTVAWEPSRFLGGTSVNVKINKGIDPEKISALIRGYLKTHGSQLQFNIVDSETLLKAQENPEMYKDLLVRIGGYSDFFVTIPKELQDEIISRSQNETI